MARKSAGKGQGRPESSLYKIVLALIGVVVIVGSGFVGVSSFGAASQGARRAAAVTPRSTDVWAFYPDGSARFTTLVYPTPAEDGTAAQVVEVAGPLVYAEGDVLRSEAIGGERLESEYLPGGEFYGGDPADLTVVYELVRIAYEPRRGRPYGLDVWAQNTPYMNPDPAAPVTSAQLITLGAGPQDRFDQVIVAVALPRGATVLGLPDLQPYRTVSIRGWDVYYFDTTALTAPATIQISFVHPGQNNPADLDPFTVDRRR
ncbi:MAG: hypothetical protein Kow00124_31820 [Anaerolineae bacterium]